MLKKKSDHTLADVERYFELVDEYHKTMTFSLALKKAQETIAETLKFRRKLNK